MQLRLSLMGFGTRWYIIIVLMFFVTFSYGESMNYTRESLDVFLEEYAYKSLIHTGVLYDATLPLNVTGMKVSAVRMRTRTLRMHGVNVSEFQVPPGVIPDPYVNRVTIVYQNLGNWSKSYYNVPGYSLVTPVIGLMFYNASDARVNNSARVNITMTGEPISVHFPQFVLPKASNLTIKCVRFGEEGLIEFTNMGMNNNCVARDQGHFSVAVLDVPPKKPEPPAVQPPMPELELEPEPKHKERLWKWLVVGFALGFATLVLLGLVGVTVYKCVRNRRIEKMEKEANEGESFENIWIGTSRMPSATVTRTQPVLEHNEVP